MSHLSNFRAVVTMMLVAFAAAVPVRAQDSATPAAPDATLYTTYSGSQTTVGWTVCGSTADTLGCYAAGSIGPFVGVGTMLEGNPFVNGDVVTRFIYVVDSGAAKVKLYVYKKVDTVSADDDIVTVTLARKITLPLTGGSTAVCSMAANKEFLFIGTNQSSGMVEVRKSNLSITEIGGSVSSITSNEYGYVTVTQGNVFTVFGPDGSGQEEGGGTDFMLDTTQAVPASVLLGSGAQPLRQRLGVRPKAQPQPDTK